MVLIFIILRLLVLKWPVLKSRILLYFSKTMHHFTAHFFRHKAHFITSNGSTRPIFLGHFGLYFLQIQNISTEPCWNKLSGPPVKKYHKQIKNSRSFQSCKFIVQCKELVSTLSFENTKLFRWQTPNGLIHLHPQV